MKIWQAHKTLADAIGDNADIDSSNLYDGVRYSKEERDSYLYQALIRVFTKAINPILMRPRKEMIRAINLLFPNMIDVHGMGLSLPPNTQIYVTGAGDLGLKQSAILLNLSVKSYGIGAVENFRGLPIPFKTSDQVAELTNSRNAFPPDLFFTYTGYDGLTEGVLHIYDPQQELRDLEASLGNIVLELTVLSYPKNPKDQNPTDDLNIEERYVDMVINTAIILMSRDDQEIEGIERIQGLIEPFMQGGQ